MIHAICDRNVYALLLITTIFSGLAHACENSVNNMNSHSSTNFANRTIYICSLAWMFVCSIVVLNHFSIRPLPCATILWTTKKVEYNEHAIAQLTISHQKKHRNRHKHTHWLSDANIIAHSIHERDTIPVDYTWIVLFTKWHRKRTYIQRIGV